MNNKQINQRLDAIDSTLLDIQEGLAPKVVTSLTSAPYRIGIGDNMSCDLVNVGDTPIAARIDIFNANSGATICTFAPGSPFQPGRGVTFACDFGNDSVIAYFA